MRLSRSHRVILLFFALILFVIAVPLVFLEFGRVGLDALSIIATTLLTLGLVILYQQQHRVLRYQQLPVLEVTDFSMTEDLQCAQVGISNVGGGPATSMKLRIDLYELNGNDPIRTVRGGLQRVESSGDRVEKKTRSSAIRPSENDISFESESKTVRPMGSSARRQDSLIRAVADELGKSRNVIYGKISIEYMNKFSEKEEYEADFSIKFTGGDDVKYELSDFQPWSDNDQHPSLGG